MGILKRQSLKASVVSYVGAAIGMLSVLFIIPYCLTVEQVGLIRLVSDAALFFGMFSLFGSSYSALYFYPRYAEDGKQLNGFLSFQMFISLVGFAVITLLLFLGKGTVISIFKENSAALLDYLYILPVMIFFAAFHLFFETHSANLLRITIPKIVREIVMRLLLIVSVVLFFFQVISLNGIIISQLIILVVAGGILFFYVNKISKHPIRFTMDFPPPEKRKEILRFNFYVSMAVFGVMLASKIDSFFLSQAKDGLAMNGVYTTAVFIIAMIEVPTRSMINISTPLLSKATHDNDLKKIDEIYKKSSITLLSAGLFIFLIIWLNVDNIFQIMPNGEKYALGKTAILYLGLSKLFDAATSVNYTIVNTSKYYRYSLVFQLMLGLFTIITAYLLIPKYGINGAAISTALSIFLYQLIIIVFVKARFNTFPFTIASLKIVAIAIVVYLIAANIPLPFHSLTQIVLRTMIIAPLFIFLTYYFNISEDINGLADGLMKRIGLKKS